jgi:hypothetical protein
MAKPEGGMAGYILKLPQIPGSNNKPPNLNTSLINNGTDE